MKTLARTPGPATRRAGCAGCASSTAQHQPRQHQHQRAGEGLDPAPHRALLEQGQAVACISGEAAPIRGCSVGPLGLGYGMLPLGQCADMLASGVLLDLTPLHVDVPLYWHAWRIQPARLERTGAALVKAARAVLLPIS